MPNRSDFVIVGNSAASVGAIEAIRSLDTDSSITVVAAEREHTYSRPLITYFMCGKVSEDNVWYRPPDFHQRNQVETILGVGVKSVVPNEKTIVLEDGTKLGYGNLLIAAGGAPIVPNIPGIDRPGVFFMNTMEDARAAKGWLAHGKRAVVIGGGLTGLKTAEALAEMGKEVTVVELAGRVLANNLDARASELVRQTFVDAGVDVLTQVSVTAVEGTEDSNDVSTAVLSTGERIACDTVFVTIGVRPRLEILEGSGIETNRGILVDRHMKTNTGNVYAAGDIAEAWDPLVGGQRVVPILPNAYIGGRVAGLNMAGREASYNVGMSANSVCFFRRPFMSAGFATEEEDGKFRVLWREDATGYRKIVVRDEKLVGLIVTDNVDRAGLLTGIMRAGIPIGQIEDDLLTGTAGLIDLPKEVREQRIHGTGRNWL